MNRTTDLCSGLMDTSSHQANHDETAMLLVRCAQSDGDAFRQLYDLEGGRLYGIALRITRSTHHAEDALHDAMLQAWRNARHYNALYGSGRTWLTSLIRYRALNAVARAGRETTGTGMPDLPALEGDPLERLAVSRAEQMLHQCLNTIEDGRRQLVTMAFLDGMTHVEVAKRTGQPLGSVKSAIRRALATLRTCLDDKL